jgi:hypothetical protein
LITALGAWPNSSVMGLGFRVSRISSVSDEAVLAGLRVTAQELPSCEQFVE